MSDRAVAWVRPTGRDVVLTLSGESPLRYFDRASAVVVRVAGQEVARLAIPGDFSEDVTLPAGRLESAGGLVEVEADQSFVPAEREGGADRRRLALRIYDLTVR
jgi:hypothetical protein